MSRSTKRFDFKHKVPSNLNVLLRFFSAQTGESDRYSAYSDAAVRLPAVFRFAVIQSYLEGFSLREIADLTGLRPRTIESLLNRGRELLLEELHAHMMGKNGPTTK